MEGIYPSEHGPGHGHGHGKVRAITLWQIIIQVQAVGSCRGPGRWPSCIDQEVMEGGGSGFLSPRFAKSWIHRESGQQLPEFPLQLADRSWGIQRPQLSNFQGKAGLR